MEKTGAWFSGLRVLQGSSEYFRNHSSTTLFRNGLFTAAAVLVASGLLLFVAALIGGLFVRAAGLTYLESQSAEELLEPWLFAEIPWAILLFPLYWCVILMWFIGLRHVMTLVFGERNPAVRTTATISLHGILPVILAALFAGIIRNAVPVTIATWSGYVLTEVLISFALVVAGWIWEGLIIVRGGQILYEQNTGRALMIWLLPYVVTCAPLIFMLRIPELLPF